MERREYNSLVVFLWTGSIVRAKTATPKPI
ncbi:hypothetical protein VTH06DRAFT_1371 [Thermothelomyces fergusii]